MNKVLPFLLLLGFSRVATCQTREIRGVLLDSRDLSSLPNGIIFVKGDTALTANADDNGRFRLKIAGTDTVLVFQCKGYKTAEKIIAPSVGFIKVLLERDTSLAAVMTTGENLSYRHRTNAGDDHILAPVSVYRAETYERVTENRFISPASDAVSMFSLGTDRASYSNIRRFITGKEIIPPEAVRIEELINYFPYHYPAPPGRALIAIGSTLSNCPWKPGDQLLRIHVQAKRIPPDSLPPANLVFLLDVSGSMSVPNKLPLLKAALRVLIPHLRAKDKVAVVLYNEVARLALPPTGGDEQEKIMDMVNNLVADGTTAGEKGITLAYKVATENFIPGGVNRVILATDGDFNVGQSADEDMRKLVLKERKTGVYLTCLGFGMGNYKDSKLETLAKWGNGNFAYIDNLEEAGKVFGQEFEGTLFTIAKDALLKVSFNPEKVQAYRLIGYENRLFTDKDSAAAQMEGGQIGTGLSVTAFYEIIPAGISSEYLRGNPPVAMPPPPIIAPVKGNRLARVELQFSGAADTVQMMMQKQVADSVLVFSATDNDFRFASAVALFGMLLRGSGYTGNGNYDRVMEIARKAIVRKDKDPYRKEFLKLVKMAKKIKEKQLLITSQADR